MSIPVPLDRLRTAVDERGPGAYLLTVSADARPHAVAVSVTWDRDCMTVEVGRRSAANATARPGVCLLFPFRTPGDYSLIVDGTVAVAPEDARRLLISPLTAVLHRPAAEPKPGAACQDDCVRVLPAKP